MSCDVFPMRQQKLKAKRHTEGSGGGTNGFIGKVASYEKVSNKEQNSILVELAAGVEKAMLGFFRG